MLQGEDGQFVADRNQYAECQHSFNAVRMVMIWFLFL
jgi:hypothetical protein